METNKMNDLILKPKLNFPKLENIFFIESYSKQKIRFGFKLDLTNTTYVLNSYSTKLPKFITVP